MFKSDGFCLVSSRKFEFMRYLFFIICFFRLAVCESQNLAELSLIDRKPIRVEIISVNDSSILYKKVMAKKILEIERYKTYKITYNDQSNPRTVIVYKQDTLEGNTLSNKEMADYMLGQGDAYKSYKNKNFFPILFGFSAGFGAPSLGFFYGPLIPIGAITAQSFFPIKQKKQWGFNPEYANNEFYIGGYERVIRRKNIRKVALSSVAGFVSGTIVLSRIIRTNN